MGMSESRGGIINGAKTATSVPCDPRKNRRTIRPAVNIHSESVCWGCGAAGAKHGALVSGVKSGGVASKLCAMASKPARDELTEFVSRYDRSSGSFVNLLC